MPKVIDHDAYRQELAAKAVEVFTEHGYNGLGMRGIAEAIGVSKSALYHYFPTKKELFSACTELILQPQYMYGTAEDEPVPQDKNAAVLGLLSELDKRYQGELTLLLDYIKEIGGGNVIADPLLSKANEGYTAELSKLVGSAASEKAYATILGGLLLRMLNGNQTSLNEIASWVTSMSDGDQT